MITIAQLAYYIGIAIIVITHAQMLRDSSSFSSASAMKMHAQVNLLAALLMAFAWFRR